MLDKKNILELGEMGEKKGKTVLFLSMKVKCLARPSASMDDGPAVVPLFWWAMKQRSAKSAEIKSSVSHQQQQCGRMA